MTIPPKLPKPSPSKPMPPKPKLTATQIGGAVFAALAVPWAGAWVGAHTGTKGTLAGTAIGSVLPVLAGWVYLRATYHARTGLAWVPWDKTRPWHVLAAGSVVALVVFVVAVAGLSGAEAKVLHKSLSAVVTGSAGSGTTLGSVVGGDAPDPSPAVLKPSGATPVPSGSVTVPPATVPATLVPSATTPGPSGSPSAYLEPHPTEPGTVLPSVFAPVSAVPGPAQPAQTQPAPTGANQ